MRYIAILRGINVGTGRKVPMADLKALCTKLGLVNVQTYIQSGNLVFELSNAQTITDLEQRLRQSFSESFGFDIPVIIRTAQEWAESISRNPFIFEKGKDEKRLYLTCLQCEPSPELLEKIKDYQFLPDRYEIIGRDIFLSCENGYGQTKINNDFFEKKLKVTATTRNWNTVMKLQELSNI